MIDNMTVYELFRNSNFFGVCETAGATADKEVQIADFELAVGVTTMVKFKYGNTATSPTLNISNTGAKPICGEDPEAEVRWEEWDVIPFTYDGTYWQMTTNPGVKVDQIPISTSSSDYRVLLGKTADNEQHLEEVYKANNFRYTPDNYELVVDDGLEDSGTEYTSNMNMIMDAAHKFAPAQTGSEVLVIGGDDYYRINCSSGNENDMRAQVVYRYELSHIVRKVRYKIEVRDSMASYQEDLFAIYVGFRTTYDETNFITPDQFVISKSYSTQNTIIEDELDLTSVGSGYIYVLANSWNLDLLKFEEITYDEDPHIFKGYLSDNSSGIIYNDDGFERSITGSVSRNKHPELKVSYNNLYMTKMELSISDNDIVLSGINNTWDGTNTSLKNAFSQRCKTVVDTFSTSTGEISDYISSATLSAAGITNLSQWTIVGLMYNDPGYNDANHWDTPRVANGEMNLTAMLDYTNNRIKINYLGANGSRTFRVTLVKTTL